MIRDALEYMANILRRDVTPIDLNIDHPTRKMFAIDGAIEVVKIPTPPRAHSLSSLADLVNCVAVHGTEAAVFFDEESVVAILDDQDSRAERAEFELEQSDQFTRLVGLSSWMDQKSFIRLLRIDLAGCLPPAALLDIVRSIRIENGTAVKSEVGRQKESIGKSIQAEVSAEKDIPEEVSLSVPVYKSYGEKEHYLIRCSVEIDPMRTDCFRMMPMPDEIERVMHLAMASIRQRLTEGLPDGTPVFYGSP